jgi:serine/threonine protein kinase
MGTDRLAALAREIDTAVREHSAGDIRQLLREAQRIAAEVFLDPAVPAMLHSPSEFGAFDELVATADRLTTVIRQLAQHHEGDAPLTVTSWPTAIYGGERLLHYRLVRPLGGGGMGNVYLAWDERLDRYVALKRLRDDQDPVRGYRRLEREARTGARLRHENVVLIYTLEYLQDEPVLVQEYVEGEDLTRRIGTVGSTEALRIATDIATGLTAAHAVGILHRDLKPGNIRIRPDGTALILDFGLGKAFLSGPDDQTQMALTDEGVAMGTPAYMSPEQLKATSLTPATDVFSFGVVLYELATGHLPFRGETWQALCAAILHSEPAPLEVAGFPQHIANLTLACLAKAPEARPPMTAVLDDLRGVSTSAALPTSLPGSVRLREFVDGTNARITATELDVQWGQAQRERARVGLDPHVVTFEFELQFDGRTKPDVAIGQMKQLLRTVALPDPESYIGRVSEDDRYKLHRGTNEVYATFALSTRHAYWAATRDGRFFYLTNIPLLERGTIPIEFLLGQTIESLAYASRYATAMNGNVRDQRLLVQVEIRNATSHLLIGTDWSHRFAASLDALQKRADGNVRSTLSVALPFLQAEVPSCVKLVFDDLMVYFDFLTVPADYYQHVFRRMADPSNSEW